MRHSDCVAMILAGGQGGQSRIMEFALSSCANSGAAPVGVQTQ